jgi:hypothetical protein
VPDPSAALAAALRYLARGWSVIPLVQRTKRPAVKLTPYLSGVARMTSEEATAYWTEHPDAGVAIITGAPSGLVVVDVDPRHGGDNDQTTLECPSPLAARTGLGGLHLYCVHPGGGRVSCGRTEKTGVDRKGDGGYAVAPPSLHPEGGQYAWLGEGDPIAVPAWVLRTPAPGPNESGNGEEREHWIADMLMAPEQCEPGTQHETLARLAWWLSAHHPRDIAHAILFSWAARLPLSRPHEPWTEANIAELLDSAYRKRIAQGYEPSFVTHLPVGIGGGAQSVAEADVFTRLDQREKTGDTWVLSEHSDWIVEYVAAPACFTEVVGEVKKGKSTLTAQIIGAALSGDDFLGFKVRKSPVVLYTEQDGVSLQYTLDRARILKHPDLHWITQSDTLGMPWDLVVKWLIGRCVALGSQVLVVDTLTQLAGIEGESENSAGAVAMVRPFQAAKPHGIACIFVRHASKSLENRGDVSRAGRGTTALTGAMDICALHFQPGTEDLRCLRLVSRLHEQLERTLEYRDGLYVVIADGRPPVGNTKQAVNTRAKVQKAWAEGVRTETEIAKAAGISRTSVRKYLREFTGGMAVVLGGDADPDPTNDQGTETEE